MCLTDWASGMCPLPELSSVELQLGSSLLITSQCADAEAEGRSSRWKAASSPPCYPGQGGSSGASLTSKLLLWPDEKRSKRNKSSEWVSLKLFIGGGRVAPPPAVAPAAALHCLPLGSLPSHLMEGRLDSEPVELVVSGGCPCKYPCGLPAVLGI